jgi:group II intron reverse transcriptase/maturase
MLNHLEVREMRNAEKILSMLSERGRQELPLQRVYRLLFNPNLYLLAYSRIAPNKGALTPGITQETADGMSLAKIEALIAAIRNETFRWKPVRRTYIQKKNGKQRPLGIPTWQDKLMQGVIQLIFEAYYEPQFSDNSHGFRPGRGCHTALQQIKMGWHGVTWFIEGDISKCFDSIDHDILMGILSHKIHDNRFLRLIRNLLRAGYLEKWRYHKTYSGTPQGAIVSPVLSNIYMNEFDGYIEKMLVPPYTQGKTRTHNREYHRVKAAVQRLHKRGQHQDAKKMQQHLRTLPKNDPNDPNYRRLRYIRYADDFLLGFTGPKSEANGIKSLIQEFLDQELKLELSPEKTLITHAASERAKFLGYEITKMQDNTKLTRIRNGAQKGKKRRAINGAIALYVPKQVIQEKVSQFKKKGKPCARNMLIHESDYSIVAKYQSELRGLVQYYALAVNVSSLYKVKWVMETSMLKTLASKHNSTTTKMAKQYKTVLKSEEGQYKCFEVVVPREGKRSLVTRFGGFPIRHQKRVVAINDEAYEHTTFFREHNELVKRLLANQCEVCGSNENCEVHHVNRMSTLRYRDGRPKDNPWTRRMVELRRKTLVACRHCHTQIHAGELSATNHTSP